MGKVAEETKIADNLYNSNQRVIVTTCRQDTEIMELHHQIRMLEIEKMVAQNGAAELHDLWTESDERNNAKIELLQEDLTELKMENYCLTSEMSRSWRPRHKSIDWQTSSEEKTHTDNFLMDFENTCLADYTRDNPDTPYPKGPERYKDKEWAKYIKTQVYPHHSDVDWTEYVAWVKAGMGDEWFTDEP